MYRIKAEHNLLTLLRQTLLFSKRSAAVIDGSEKRNGWLNLELQSLHVVTAVTNNTRPIAFKRLR